MSDFAQYLSEQYTEDDDDIPEVYHVHLVHGGGYNGAYWSASAYQLLNRLKYGPRLTGCIRVDVCTSDCKVIHSYHPVNGKRGEFEFVDWRPPMTPIDPKGIPTEDEADAILWEAGFNPIEVGEEMADFARMCSLKCSDDDAQQPPDEPAG